MHTFSITKLLSSLFPYCSLCKEGTIRPPIYRVGSYFPPSSGESIYINYLYFYCTDICLFSPFLNVFSHLFISIWAHGYLFHTWDYNTVYTTLFSVWLKMFRLWLLGALWLGSWVPLKCPHHVILFLLFVCLLIFSLLSGYLISF